MKRPLTPEEKLLWEKVTAKDKPLGDEKMRRCGDEKKKKMVVTVKKETLHRPLPLIPSSSRLLISNYAGIDLSTAERFRKGAYPIDATLDLHGLSRDKAQAALFRFVASHYERGSRCLLVITGKGLILRESLPHWLAESDLRAVILAFDAAKPKHGGSGAFYILLKRKR